ncbi:unnamed protein product [Arabidopsis halleri]
MERNWAITQDSSFGQDKLKPAEGLRPVMVSRTMGGFTINIIDTPGLVEAGYVNHQALELIKGFLVHRTIDVLLYVDRLDVYRVDELDKQVVKAITETFGKEIWCKTLLVLTHAQFSPPDELSYETISSKRSDSLLKTIRAGSKMRKQEFEDSATAVVYAENSGRCSKNDKDEKALPNGEAWIPNLVKQKLISNKPEESNSCKQEDGRWILL